MKDLFITGGLFFMWLLTLLFLVTIVWIVSCFFLALHCKQEKRDTLLRKLGYGKTWGLFSLISGIFGQMLGLSVMFKAIKYNSEMGAEVTIPMIVKSVKASMIVTIYGLLIYLLSLLLCFAANAMIRKRVNKLKRANAT